jgi:hypothetical protein
MIRKPTMTRRAQQPAPRDDDFKVGQSLSARIDTDRLAAALNRYFHSVRPRPSQSSLVLTALEDFLAKLGHMEPPAEG